MEELFEFDLSDVDVAAFESVATTPPHSMSPTPQQLNVTQTIPEAPTIETIDLKDVPMNEETVQTTDEVETMETLNNQVDTAPSTPPDKLTNQSDLATISNDLQNQQQQQQNLITSAQHIQPQQQTHHQQRFHMNQQQQQQLQHHVSQLATATGQQPCKILLIPINSSKQGTPGVKHLIQLPPGASPLTMSALKTASGKKQILHFATKTEKTLYQHHQSQQQLQPSLPPPPTPQPQPQQPPLPTTPMVANEVPKRKPCNCTKSQCLKLYCDCFANGEFCSGCNCTNCFNSLSKEKERQKAISQCLERNPEAFRPKIGKAIKASVGEPLPESIERRHTKGCNCKRSGCLKNYCECYEAKILCSNLCKCCGCKNYEESFERKTLMQLANSTSENARGILKNLLPTNNGSNAGKDIAKGFLTDEVISASLHCLLQSAQQAEKDGMPEDAITKQIQVEMGKCLRMIVDSLCESSSPKKR